ncbi:MAG: mechanosensitive ion channel [Clostridiales bacterium]|nr:mechanosensitive ion channel [Clostridiales bacterium]
MLFMLTENVTEVLEETLSDDVVSPGVLMQYLQNSLPTVLDFIVKVIIAIIVLIVGRFVIKALRKLIRRLMEKTKWDEGVKQFFDKLIFVAMWCLLILLILGRFGITAASVVAIIGSAGLSIGLGLQGALSNFAGGVLILMLHPFKVGDYIKDSKGNEGTVTQIELFYTELHTIDNNLVVIPNGDLANDSLINYTHEEKRRIDLEISVSYHADLREARQVLTDVAMAEEKRLPDEELTVYVSELGEHAVKLGLRVWTAAEDYWPTKWRLTENIKNALDDAGIEIPFPQVTVSYDDTRVK